ncbi:MAG: type II toxin-antitoxin system HicB family antitoxin [Anaerolineaceae bacterium]|nr:MAG: type II toxin-antitoxin system HicB family antitoxin [Anaerolineaceae bacterium]
MVEYYDGQDDGDDGLPYYVASCQEIVAVTDGRTWGELMRNIHEMIDASLEGEDTVALYNLVPNPRIVITMELPENYAEIA